MSFMSGQVEFSCNGQKLSNVINSLKTLFENTFGFQFYHLHFKEFLLEDFENRMGVNLELLKVNPSAFEKSNLRKEADKCPVEVKMMKGRNGRNGAKTTKTELSAKIQQPIVRGRLTYRCCGKKGIDNRDLPRAVGHTLLVAVGNEMLFANLGKYEFCVEHGTFLGYVMNFQGLQVGAIMVQAIKDWLTSKSTFEGRSFYGFTSFYRKYIKDQSTITRSLIDGTNFDVKRSKFCEVLDLPPKVGPFPTIFGRLLAELDCEDNTLPCSIQSTIKRGSISPITGGSAHTRKTDWIEITSMVFTVRCGGTIVYASPSIGIHTTNSSASNRDASPFCVLKTIQN
ncbi:hypothetical protein M9H77_03046 [Catharanthus roseus]|uniref:Uncharacterized protein n=1 Tax=Catharanthus roseus TaxID=4058 RepID=A0ACC0CA12_CATRO|nr:hypothetical protein M9H77_03046 [Catharanthus roseus]